MFHKWGKYVYQKLEISIFELELHSKKCFVMRANKRIAYFLASVAIYSVQMLVCIAKFLYIYDDSQVLKK